MRLRTSGPSIFSYPLTRPYPYQWITWAVLVGGTIIAVLFSFVAVASNAYEFVSIYTSDPNGTVDARAWYASPPFSWISDMEATCQPALLTAGSTYLTTNRAFVWTLERMRANGEVLSAAGYRNTTLEACQVADITVNLLRNDNTRYSDNQNFWTWGASTATARTTCTVVSESGPLQINLTTTLPKIGDRSQMVDTFLAQNTSSSNANMWYGVQLAAAWYGQLSTAMAYSTPDGPSGTQSWGAGSIILTRNANVSDYTSADFFIANAGLSTDSGGLRFMHPPNTIQDWTTQYSTQQFFLPNISMSVDAFGKSLYSLLLLDFGVNGTSNALLSAQGVEYLQSRNDTDLAAASGKDIGTVEQRYDSATDPPISDATTPATLFSQYLCSVPKQKGGLSIFVAVVLADLVFLNACWTIFAWVVTYWLGRRDPDMMHCAACRQSSGEDLDVERPKMIQHESEEILLQPGVVWNNRRRPS